MRAALWLIGLFGVASAVALFASSNGSTVTIFWPPYRLDVSLNLVLMALIAGFVLLYLALRALALVLALPARARDWRLDRHEQAMQAGLLDALLHLMGGRYSRARKAAELALARESNMRQLGGPSASSTHLRVVAHVLAAESAQALQDASGRESHVQSALTLADGDDAPGSAEAVMMRAAHWALKDGDANAARQWLDGLPVGAARRTLALRLRLRLARLTANGPLALETTRLLAKHKAFSALQARSLLRALVIEALLRCPDLESLHRLWDSLDEAEAEMPEVACQAAVAWLRLEGDAAVALDWLLPIWQRSTQDVQNLEPAQKLQLLHALESCFDAGACAPDWLARIEAVHKRWPADAPMQYLAGVACWHAQLWGKAQQAIEQALPRLDAPYLQARAWQILADLAQRRSDEARVTEAWRHASSLMLKSQRPTPAVSEPEAL